MTGDCFKAAGEMVVRDANLVLCHGIPTGTGGIVEGERYVHAWAELRGVLVFDYSNDREVAAPRAIYYEAGQIRDEEVVRYTRDEALALMRSTGHYGPWDPSLTAVEEVAC